MRQEPITTMVVLLIALIKLDSKEVGKIKKSIFSVKVIEHLRDDDYNKWIQKCSLDVKVFTTAVVEGYIKKVTKHGFFSFLFADEFVISDAGRLVVSQHHNALYEKLRQKEKVT